MARTTGTPGRSWALRRTGFLIVGVAATLLLSSQAIPGAGGAEVSRFHLSGMSLGAGGAGPAGGPAPAAGIGSTNASPPRSLWSVDQLRAAPAAPVVERDLGVGPAGSTFVGPASFAPTEILVTLAYSNASSLTHLLVALSDPLSPQYHHYLTGSEFDARFGGSSSVYESAVAYFRSFGVDPIGLHPDRASLSFRGTQAQLSSIFGTTFGDYVRNGRPYFAPIRPATLPAPLASHVTGVVGLSNYSQYEVRTALSAIRAGGPAPASVGPLTGAADPPTPCTTDGGPFACTTVDGRSYPVSPTISDLQWILPSDLQVTYDVNRLYDAYGYASNLVAATILWDDPVNTSAGPYCQTLPPGSWASDFYAPDVRNYLRYTVPAGEPQAAPVPVQIAGAGAYANGPLGESAICDTSGAYVENTLDMDMLGSLAPGALLLQVYGQGGSSSTTDTALADILSPDPSDGPGFSSRVVQSLGQVQVISNSWTTGTSPDASWDGYLIQAQIRGITVLAATGDCGCNSVVVPAAASFDNFGDTAVGGTVLWIDPATLARTSEYAWSGSAGGVSLNLTEPFWQRASANPNAVVQAAYAAGGRGEPDLSAIGADVPLTLTKGRGLYNITTVQSDPGSAFVVDGTSISTPTVAAIVLMIDHALADRGRAPVGFLNPDLYSLGDLSACAGAGTGIHDITIGANSNYSALPGYDLVTGWGVLDAYVFQTWLDLPWHYYGNCYLLLLHSPPTVTLWHVSLGVPCTGCRVPLVLPAANLSAANGTIGFRVPNGTYEYLLVGPNRSHPSVAPVANVTVNGTGTQLNISFVPGGVAKLKFREHGLPRGTPWCVGVVAQVCGTTHTLVVPNLAAGAG